LNRNCTYYYDGAEYSISHPSLKNRPVGSRDHRIGIDASIGSPEGGAGRRTFYEHDLLPLFAAGIIPDVNPKLTLSTLAQYQKPPKLILTSGSFLNGDEFVVARLPPIENQDGTSQKSKVGSQYWFDRHGRIVRWVLLYKEKPRKDLKIVYADNDSLALPKSYCLTEFLFDKPSRIENCQISTAEINVPTNIREFQYRPDSGEVVERRGKGEPSYYVEGRPESASDDPNVVAKSVLRASRMRYCAIAIGTLLVMVCALAVFLRMSRNRSSLAALGK
jgi:hypothetical protein